MYNALYETYYRIRATRSDTWYRHNHKQKHYRINIARSAWHEENIRHKGITRKTKAPDTSQRDS